MSRAGSAPPKGRQFARKCPICEAFVTESTFARHVEECLQAAEVAETGAQIENNTYAVERNPLSSEAAKSKQRQKEVTQFARLVEDWEFRIFEFLDYLETAPRDVRMSPQMQKACLMLLQSLEQAQTKLVAANKKK